MRQPASEIAREISRKLELAMLLEVSAYPKPGNVHRTRNHSGTKFEHYLASAVAARTHFEKAAERGVLISGRKLPHQEARVGPTIRDAVDDIMSAQRGGNTSLGTVMLLVPLAVAAGMTASAANRGFSLKELRSKLHQTLAFTNANDTIALYEAIARARPGGLGVVPELDVRKPGSTRKILRSGLNLLDIAGLAAERDSICMEWVTDYRTTFEIGYSYFRKDFARTRDLNEATVNTYLKILSEIPDTLIARKTSIQKARWVTDRAKSILADGGLTTSKGRRGIERLDSELGAQRNLLNPGATADITAAVLALFLLTGHRT